MAARCAARLEPGRAFGLAVRLRLPPRIDNQTRTWYEQDVEQPQMKLDDFAKSMHHEIEKFVGNWKAKMKSKDKANWPAVMTEEGWRQQFLAHLGIAP